MRARRNLFTCLLAGLCAVAVAGVVRADGPAGASRAKDAPKAAQPIVEVVFCLDTTGSMSGLIEAAKQKIWTISNQIASGKPSPRVRVGLVAYRDRRDQYVTKVFDLTDNLDEVYTNLMAFRAGGGNDFPESVNQALNEAVTKITWSKDRKTLKMIFLVGDAPPHMDYKDDVKYPETCKLAVKNDIIINTVQCGNHAQTRKYWTEICRLAEGSYVQIDQNGGPIVAVATPFDKELGEINAEISRTTLTYGARTVQAQGKAQAEANAKLAAPAAADRASFYARKGGGTSYDLLQNIKAGKVKLKELKKEELPDELRELPLAKQQEYLKKVDARRQKLSARALELSKQRSAFIAKKQAEEQRNRVRDSFDHQVLRILQRQATRNGSVRYEAPAAEKK